MFDQYLRTIQIPVFEYKISGGKLRYRWTNCVEGFNMPLKITAGNTLWLNAETKWKELQTNATTITIDPNFYIGSKQL
jgi:hypothetical protein